MIFLLSLSLVTLLLQTSCLMMKVTSRVLWIEKGPAFYHLGGIVDLFFGQMDSHNGEITFEDYKTRPELEMVLWDTFWEKAPLDMKRKRPDCGRRDQDFKENWLIVALRGTKCFGLPEWLFKPHATH
jgi:hypothetical protein